MLSVQFWIQFYVCWQSRKMQCAREKLWMPVDLVTTVQKSEPGKPSEPWAQTMLVGIFQKCIQMPIPPTSVLHSSTSSGQCFFGGVSLSQTKRNVRLSSNKTHAYIFLGTHFDLRERGLKGWGVRGALWSGKPFGLLFWICFRPRLRLTCIDYA